jgi:hypothetical protein
MKTPSLLLTAALSLFASTAFAEEKPPPSAAFPAEPRSSPTRAAMPKGVQSSLVFGDPTVGPFIVSHKIPAGTTLMPHMHSAEEVTTVVSGTLEFGTGEVRFANGPDDPGKK